MRWALEILFAVLVGGLFGLGLVWSGMADPQNVLGFLDVAGVWNPTLAFVMGGVLVVTIPAFAIARRRTHSIDGRLLALPRRWPPDPALLGGSVLFGLGWGLSGICPGPAIVRVGQGDGAAAIFVAAMIMGQIAAIRLRRR